MNFRGKTDYLLEHLFECVIAFAKDGRITYANASARQVLEYADISSVTIADIFPGGFIIDANQVIVQFPIGQELAYVEAYRENRTCFPVVATIHENPEGEGYYCVAYDATQRVFYERQIEQAKTGIEEAAKVKNEFVANVTHELRTPVNGILGNTRELVEIEEDARKKKLLSLIERGCADMNAIINNILDFSKLESGKFTLEEREFDFYDMIDYVKANHKNKIIEKGLDFLVVVSPDVPRRMIGDELRIIQILNNLLSNACKFTSVGRIVLEVVQTGRVNDRVELFFLVIDTGIGIDKAGQDKLFKSFSQVDASISRRFGGTGLGLNISKQLVELMNGEIHVESELGKGSMFSFHIWIQIPESEAQNASANAPQIEIPSVRSLFDSAEEQVVWTFGTPENREEIEKKISKLLLSMEMDNWEKAEGFAETVKQLTQNAPQEIKSAALRLKMSVQKADYDKAQSAYGKLKEAMQLE